MYVNVCPREMADQVFARLVISKSDWDKCMNQTACKIGVIVAIVVVGLIVLWVISTLIRCLCCGLTCLEALCCCCCRRGRRQRYAEPPQSAYNNPNMYAPQPMRQAEPVYQPVQNQGYYNRYDHEGYKASY